jgi:hypothetical protein
MTYPAIRDFDRRVFEPRSGWGERPQVATSINHVSSTFMGRRPEVRRKRPTRSAPIGLAGAAIGGDDSVVSVLASARNPVLWACGWAVCAAWRDGATPCSVNRDVCAGSFPTGALSLCMAPAVISVAATMRHLRQVVQRSLRYRRYEGPRSRDNPSSWGTRARRNAAGLIVDVRQHLRRLSDEIRCL